MKTSKRRKKQMVEREVVLCQCENNVINKLEERKKRVLDGSRTNMNTNFHKPK